MRALWLLVVLLAGCSSTPPPPAFTATLVSPTDVELRWPDDDAAGHMVEYANDPAGPWTTLQFLPPHTSSYRHPDLIPETPFYYRERPFSGPVSTSDPATGVASVRSGDAAAPGAFHSSAGSDGTVKFGWTDRSSDEDGFLVEIRRPGEPGFSPIEFSDPNTTSCVLSLVEGEQGSVFRVRAFSYGPVSPVVSQRTGKDS